MHSPAVGGAGATQKLLYGDSDVGKAAGMFSPLPSPWDLVKACPHSRGRALVGTEQEKALDPSSVQLVWRACGLRE